MKEYAFRDPVHGNIYVRDATVLALIDSPEMQRLRRIRQLGAAFTSYPGAEHSRFGHSLGVYHLMGRVLDHLCQRQVVRLEPEEQTLALCAALLHDVGHGPFSHAFEKITGSDHEQRTAEVILSPATGVGQVLRQRAAAWPQRIVDLLQGAAGAGPQFVQDLLSSQLDVDRMDYLLRDSLLCGVPYGNYDLERLIYTLTVVEQGGRQRVAVSQKGLTAAEAFLLGRYFMYWNVYFHRATRSMEIILERLLARAADLVAAGREGEMGFVPPDLHPFLQRQTPTLADYLRLDEADVLYAIKRWLTAADPVLADLAARFLYRRLLHGIAVADPHLVAERQADLLAAVAAAGYSEPVYYFQLDRTAGIPYTYYVKPETDHFTPIWVLFEQGGQRTIAEIAECSDVLPSITRQVQKFNLYVPKEAAAAVAALLA